MGQHLWLPGGLFEGQISYFFFKYFIEAKFFVSSAYGLTTKLMRQTEETHAVAVAVAITYFFLPPAGGERACKAADFSLCCCSNCFTSSCSFSISILLAWLCLFI